MRIPVSCRASNRSGASAGFVNFGHSEEPVNKQYGERAPIVTRVESISTTSFPAAPFSAVVRAEGQDSMYTYILGLLPLEKKKLSKEEFHSITCIRPQTLGYHTYPKSQPQRTWIFIMCRLVFCMYQHAPSRHISPSKSDRWAPPQYVAHSWNTSRLAQSVILLPVHK